MPVSRSNGKSLQIELVDRRCFDSLVQWCDWQVFQTATGSGSLYSSLVDLYTQFYESSKRCVAVWRRPPEKPCLIDDVFAAIKWKELLWTRCRRSPKSLDLRTQSVCYRAKSCYRSNSVSKTYVLFWKVFGGSVKYHKTWWLFNQLRGVDVKASMDEVIEKTNFRSASLSVADTFNLFFRFRVWCCARW